MRNGRTFSGIVFDAVAMAANLFIRTHVCFGVGKLDRERRRADSNRLPLLQVRVIGHVLQGFARACKCRISKPVSLLCLAQCCTVLRSRWCQSGVKPYEKLWSGVEIARPYALGSHSYCKIYLKR
jgi:hypothetical protein